MTRMMVVACAVAALAGCSKPATDSAGAPAKTPAPATAPSLPPAVPTKALPGPYTLDLSHSTVVFRLHHLGFSKYTGQFTKLDAKLNFDPANPAAMSVEATIDAKSLSIPEPPAGFLAELLGKDWLDAQQHPTITFRSTKVDQTGPATAKVTGDFTLHGVTKPVVLDVTFNGGYPPFNLDPGGRIGFSAKTKINRSDFGISAGIPAPGSNLGVGDEIEVDIETEFAGAAAAAPPAP